MNLIEFSFSHYLFENTQFPKQHVEFKQKKIRKEKIFYLQKVSDKKWIR